MSCVDKELTRRQIHPAHHDERKSYSDLVSVRFCVLLLWQDLQEMEQEQQRAQDVRDVAQAVDLMVFQICDNEVLIVACSLISQCK